MEILIIFLAGYICATYVFPILDLFVQHLVNIFTLKATVVQSQINKLNGEVKELQPQIGFSIQNNKDEYYDEDDMEDKCIGFKK